jgi:sarcosine oxidase subunit beta
MAPGKRTAEVVIIGGGIMGLSTAYHLARAGQKDVLLLEQNLLAQGSTGLSVGGIRQQFSHASNILLSQESVRVFERFGEVFETDIHFRQVGYVFLVQREETWAEFQGNVETQRRLNVPVEILSPEEIQKRWPYLFVDDLKGGTYCPEDGYADPYLVAMGYANAARQLGVRIEEKTKVIGVQLEKGNVLGVETEYGPIAAPLVVNAAGPWASGIGAMAGLDLPVKPYRRQVFITKAFPYIPPPVPLIIDQDRAFYFRSEGPGILFGMSDPDEPSSFHTNVDWAFLEKVIDVAVKRVAVLARAELLRGWAGLYEVTPDGNPIIGESPGLKGFYCAVGFSGHGFQHGPAVGRIMSELILRGRTDFDLEPFSFDRFSRTVRPGERQVV